MISLESGPTDKMALYPRLSSTVSTDDETVVNGAQATSNFPSKGSPDLAP